MQTLTLQTFPPDIDFDTSNSIDHRTLISGEINTGKTTLTGKLADHVCHEQKNLKILVLDMAPTIPRALKIPANKQGISGFVTFQGITSATIFRGGLVPPRLMGTSPSHSIELAYENRRRIDSWLQQIDPRASFDLLIINDLSMYFQTGEPYMLAPLLPRAKTIIANGYMGSALGTGRLSAHEQAGMRTFRAWFDQEIVLTQPF